jgi:PAS domain S-box-containing protein
VLLLVIDEDFRVREANDLAARFTGKDVSALSGLPPGGALGCLSALTDPLGCGQGLSCGQCPLRLAISDTLTSGNRHDGIEAWLPQCVGGLWRQRCLLVSTTALKLDNLNKVLVCAQDITERKQAEVALARQRDELQRQAELINLSHDAIVTADANRVIRGWNRGAEEMYGWTEAEAVGNVMHLFLRTGGCNSIAQNGEVFSREDQWDGELEHIRRDGQPIRVESRQVILRNAAGLDIRILEINRDITHRRRAEDALNRTVRQLESALAEKTVLLQEIHHRVKNNLAVTASLLSMKADGCGPEAKLALDESQQRIHSIALVHEHLYSSERLDRIDIGEYARELAQGVYSASGGENRGIGLDLELDPIELGIERAVPCALILNELLSNAFKYAFPGGRTGRILVSFRRPEPGCCELAVEDDGVGLPAGALGGQNKSLGLRIVAILTSQLDGSLEQKACPGTRIVLRFPVEP